MDLVRVSAMFQLWRDLRRREARLSITRIKVSDIHWGLGGGEGGSRAFRYWNFESSGMKLSRAGSVRGKA